MSDLLIDRFNALFVRGDGCWEWSGNRNQKGYGVFIVAEKHVYAHRFAYKLYVGKISNGQWILHHCDNPSCVRPSHLHLGDNLMNVREKMSRGRHGGAHPNCKMTREKALAIFAAKGSARAIANQFGSTKTTVRRIKSGDHWVHYV